MWLVHVVQVLCLAQLTCWMSVVRGCEELVEYVYMFGSGRRGWRRGLGLGITNPVGTGGVLDTCFGCGGEGGEWVGGLDQGLGEFCYVCVRCESGLSV